MERNAINQDMNICINLRKTALMLGVIFLFSCNQERNAIQQSNLGQIEQHEISRRDSKNPEGFMNQYATVFVRTRGEKVIYEERGESVSPTITYPGHDPVCFYELTGISYRKFSNVNEVVNFMASRGWKLVTLNNSFRDSEEIFWITFESITRQSLGGSIDKAMMETQTGGYFLDRF